MPRRFLLNDEIRTHYNATNTTTPGGHNQEEVRPTSRLGCVPFGHHSTTTMQPRVPECIPTVSKLRFIRHTSGFARLHARGGCKELHTTHVWVHVTFVRVHPPAR